MYLHTFAKVPFLPLCPPPRQTQSNFGVWIVHSRFTCCQPRTSTSKKQIWSTSELESFTALRHFAQSSRPNLFRILIQSGTNGSSSRTCFIWICLEQQNSVSVFVLSRRGRIEKKRLCCVGEISVSLTGEVVCWQKRSVWICGMPLEAWMICSIL